MLLPLLFAMATSPFTVAGIGLGMDVDQVRAALIAHGYRDLTASFSPSYKQRVQDAAARELRARSAGNDTAVSNLRGAQAEQSVSVIFTDDQDGRRIAESVRYTAPSLAHPITTVGSDLAKRYGPPTRMRPYGAAWCLNRDPDDCDVGVTSRSDQLTVRAESDLVRDITTVELDTGEDAKRRWAEALKRRVRALITSPRQF